MVSTASSFLSVGSLEAKVVLWLEPAVKEREKRNRFTLHTNKSL